jgi:ubiquinone/menaquinone biosynthesis C-methylase UbiE
MIRKYMTNKTPTPPVCSYEGSNYQETFWDQGTRAYEDASEAVALKRLLPTKGRLMLELGAGAGRNTPRYSSYERVVLLDYSRTQLEQAHARLGDAERYVYVAADVYRLPFVAGLFDSATMIRTLHHMAEPQLALQSVRRTLQKGAIFILEFANKRNTKSVLRWWLRKQSWNPFSRDPVEFAELNFDFHPKAVRQWLCAADFEIKQQLSVSHFRVGFLKKHIPLRLLVVMDSLLQWTGSFAQYSPSVFTRAEATGISPAVPAGAFFCCPVCGEVLPEEKRSLECNGCGRTWEYHDGIYDFRV